MNKITISTRGGQTYDVDPSNIASKINLFGEVQESYRGQLIHSDNGPAMIVENGADHHYYYRGIRMPSSQYWEMSKLEPRYFALPSGGSKREWRHKLTRKVHRSDGPAIETSDKTYTAWMTDGIYHRVGGPAVTVSTPGVHEDLYYYMGKLHNPNGPAKINHITGRKSYYLNGVRYSKSEFMAKTRAKSNIKTVVAIRNAYNAYHEAYSRFNSLDLFKSNSIENLMKLVRSDRPPPEKRAAALGIYNAFAKIKDRVTITEFTKIYESIVKDEQSLYIMSSDDKSYYKLYVATYLIHELDASGIFTTLSADPMQMDIVSDAICHKDDSLLSYSDFSDEKSISPEADAPLSQKTEVEDHSDLLNWTLPLMVAAGVTMAAKMYKGNAGRHKVEKKDVRELACTTIKK